VSRPAPPSGATPPSEAYQSDGTPIDLQALAEQVCARYRQEFPDEEERYGGAGVKWCLHDNQYLLAWAIQDARDGTVLLIEQVEWLSKILDSRGFPVERLVRDLEIAAEVAGDSDELTELASLTSQRLLDAARTLPQDDTEPRTPMS
jgi:hypothetical protein